MEHFCFEFIFLKVHSADEFEVNNDLTGSVVAEFLANFEELSKGEVG
jgi:hypothetical protein